MAPCGRPSCVHERPPAGARPAPPGEGGWPPPSPRGSSLLRSHGGEKALDSPRAPRAWAPLFQSAVGTMRRAAARARAAPACGAHPFNAPSNLSGAWPLLHAKSSPYSPPTHTHTKEALEQRRARPPGLIRARRQSSRPCHACGPALPLCMHAHPGPRPGFLAFQGPPRRVPAGGARSVPSLFLATRTTPPPPPNNGPRALLCARPAATGPPLPRTPQPWRRPPAAARARKRGRTYGSGCPLIPPPIRPPPRGAHP
ncbi:MAG: hypothetical protein J3K34DRAFT_227005 [Monoraphidium minutum]|nr:MAG: hypothetical protein J3K34DRAFT_227005 [Monoraphidium minutum]